MEKKLLLQDVVARLVEQKGYSKARTEMFLKAFFELLEEALIKDRYVKISGFGTMKLIEVSERESVNIQTGERIQIDGHSKISFTPDTLLKDLVNRPFSHFSTIILNEGTPEEAMNAVPPVEDESEKTEEVEPIAELAQSKEEVVTPISEEDTTLSSNDDCQPKESVVTSSVIELEELDTLKAPEPLENETEKLSSNTHVDALLLEKTTPQTEHLSLKSMNEEKKELSASGRKSNHWKNAFIVLLLLHVLVAVYFVGYYRLLGIHHCCFVFVEDIKTSKEPQASISQLQQTVRAEEKKQDTIATRKVVSQTKQKVDTVKKKRATPNLVIKTPPVDYKEEARKYQQLPGSPSLIVGTLSTHVLKAGDNIYKVAQNVYGDKNYARYIIVYNHIENPDLIPAGQRIKLPKLVSRKSLQ